MTTIDAKIDMMLPLDKSRKTVIRQDLERFKVDMFNCDGWAVPTPVEATLKELCKKHNDLVDHLSMDI